MIGGVARRRACERRAARDPHRVGECHLRPFGYGIATWRWSLSAERTRVEFRDRRRELRLDATGDARRGRAGAARRSTSGRAGSAPGWCRVPSSGGRRCSGITSAGPPRPSSSRSTATTPGSDDGFVVYEISGDWSGGLPDRRLLVWDVQAESRSARSRCGATSSASISSAQSSRRTSPLDDPLRYIGDRPAARARRLRERRVVDRTARRGRRTRGAHVRDRRHARDRSARRRRIGATLRARRRTVGRAVRPHDRTPDLVCTRASVGAALLGGTKWFDLAAVGRVEESHPERARPRRC